MIGSLERDKVRGFLRRRFELKDLPFCHKRFKWILEAEARPQIVRVHNNVRYGVDQRPVLRSSISATEVQQDTPNDTDRGMVIDMQEAELFSRITFCNDEKRVEPVEIFAQIMHEHEPFAARAEVRIEAKHIRETDNWRHSDRHVRTNGDLDNIVHAHHIFDVEVESLGKVPTC